MICRLTGQVTSVGRDLVEMTLGGIAYEVHVPAASADELRSLIGSEITLHTLQYFEGTPAGAHLVPRLVGFLRPEDRTFFNLLTRVKGISIRKGLRAMSLPVAQIASAIERGDVRLLAGLPELGKTTASRVVSELQGKLDEFAAAATEPAVATGPMSEAQRLAVDILVQWGDRRADAERWVAAAVNAHGDLSEPEEIVRAAYRCKEGG